MWKKISIQLILLSIVFFSIFYVYKFYFKTKDNIKIDQSDIVQNKSSDDINNNKSNFDIDDKTNADVDNQNNLIKNLSYFSKDNLGTEYIIESKYSELNLDNVDVIRMQNVSAKIILVNGDFVSSTFSFEAKDKIKIIPLKTVLKDKKDFEKIRDFFNDQKNSLTSLNHALVHDGIFLEIEDNYSFNKPLVIYNFFNKSSENKIINNKCFISLGKNSKLNVLECYKAEDSIKYFNNTIHHYSIHKNSILKKFSINKNLDNSYYYHLTNVKSYSNSIFENFLFSSGSSFVKNEIHCN